MLGAVLAFPGGRLEMTGTFASRSNIRSGASPLPLDCTVHGAGRGDEGVCLELRLGKRRLLLDCGLTDLTPLIGRGDALDAVLCSHAHRSSSFGLMEFQSRFPQVPVYASEVTRRLMPLNWAMEWELPDNFQGLPWRSPIAITEDIIVELLPAGHLPGAALFVITYGLPGAATQPMRVVYTGDFFLSNSRLVEGLPLEEARSHRPDVLILDGNYGTARHGRRRSQENAAAEQVRQALDQGQSVLMPVTPLGMAQELIMLLRSHHRLTGRDVSILADGAIARGCDAYLQILDQLPSSVQNFARHQNLFWDDRVRPRLQRLTDGFMGSEVVLDIDSEGNPLDTDEPVIVLADETQPLDRFLDGSLGEARSWRLLLLENSSAGLIERAFQGAKSSGATVDFYMLSEHCDGLGTLQLIHNLRPQHAVFVHGAAADLQDLASLEELNSRYKLHCPEAGATVLLPIAEIFQQPSAPAERYEGEVNEGREGVEIQLPQAISLSEAWQALIDTGIIEARWQGNELVIRGLSQQELLEDRWVAPDRQHPPRYYLGNPNSDENRPSS
ncbi:MAG: MBL fold metallo-hydrolase [Cyanobacteria bacterium P01_F01_bin.153]